MPRSDVDDVQIELRPARLTLDDHEAEGGAQALRRVASGPEMSCHRSGRDIEVFRRLAECPRHMAILAVLAPESRLGEVLAPFEERLGLLSDYSAAKRVATGTHGRGLYFRFSNRLMGRFDLVGPSNLSVGPEMAAGTGQASSLLSRRSRHRLGDFRLIDLWNLKGLRKMTDIT